MVLEDKVDFKEIAFKLVCKILIKEIYKEVTYKVDIKVVIRVKVDSKVILLQEGKHLQLKNIKCIIKESTSNNDFELFDINI